MMAARALAHRLWSAQPRTIEEVRHFIACEGNEVHLGTPCLISDLKGLIRD